MEKIAIPYHTSSVELSPSQDVKAILKAALDMSPGNGDPAEVVERALDTLIGNESLEKLARGKIKVTIITSDHTRPVPSAITLPILLRRIRSGNPDAEITILIATGAHRASTAAELVARFGRDIVEHEKIVIHDSRRDEEMVDIGTLPSGGRCRINRHAVEADLLLAEGFIEPHFFAGYSGGRKAVLPGVASLETVMANHCAEFIDSPRARAGILDGNPIHRDMIWAAETANLRFICNVILDEEKKIIHAVAGHFDTAHRAGCDWLKRYVEVERVPGDIIVVGNGGYPLDQNIYQAVKGLTAAEACCRPGGVIVLVAACSDGHGGESFYRAVKKSRGAGELLERIRRRPRQATEPDQWEYQILARILEKHTVILVSDMLAAEIVEDMKMIPASAVDEAVEQARRICRTAGVLSPEIVVIPDGVGVIVEAQDE